MALSVHLPALSGRALGLVLIFLTAIIWVAASFVSQLLVTNEEGRTNFNVPPFLLTYLSTSVFTVFLPLVQLKSLLQETWLLRRSFKYKPLQDDEESAHLTSAAATADADAAASVGIANGSSGSTSCAAAGAGGLTADLELAEAAAAADQASAAARASRAAHKEALTAAAQCFLLWFAAQFLFNQSLQLTSVTSNTILSSTSSLFTFALSMVFLKEPYSVAKLASIAACIGGTLLVTLSDDSSSSAASSVKGSSLAAAAIGAASNSTSPVAPPAGGSGTPASHSVWGDMLCLVSAAFYACYTIVLRKALPDDDEANVALFFGYVGLLCSVAFAPVVALSAGVGALHLKTIPPKAYLIILVQGILNYCLSDYLWAHAVLLLGPTIATLGLSVQIPVAAVVEAIIGHPQWLSSGGAMAMTLSGTALIMAGFVAGNLAGGGKVVGSHHRDDHEADPQERCRSPGRLEDDSFTGGSSRQQHTPAPAAGQSSRPIGSPHRSSPQRNGVFRSSTGSDSGSESDDLPQSPLLHGSKAQQQQQQQQQQQFTDGPVMPVSTHARILPANGSSRSPHRSSGSSPKQRQGSPSRRLVSSSAGGQQRHKNSTSSSRSPRTAAAGTQQLLLSQLRQQQQRQQEDGADSHLVRRQPQPSQQWESIELSSSPFGSDASRSQHEEQQQQPQPSSVRPSVDDAQAAAAAAAASNGVPLQAQGRELERQHVGGDAAGQPSAGAELHCC